MGRQVPLLHISAGSQFRNTFKSSKKSDTYILAGVLWFTMNVDCSAPAVLFMADKDAALQRGREQPKKIKNAAYTR